MAVGGVVVVFEDMAVGGVVVVFEDMAVGGVVVVFAVVVFEVSKLQCVVFWSFGVWSFVV